MLPTSQFNDYRDYILEHLDRLRKQSLLSAGELARKVRLDGARLSGVLNKKFHCSSDQLFAIARQFDINQDEYEFLEALYHYNTSQNEQRLVFLRRKLEKAKRKLQQSENHFHSNGKAYDPILRFYYDPWYMIVFRYLQAVHTEKNTEAMQKHLGLTEERLADILTDLENFQMIQLHGGRYVVKNLNVQRPNDPRLMESYTQSMRQVMANRRSQDPSCSYINLSTVFCAPKDLRDDLLIRLNRVIRAAEVESGVSSRNPTEILNLSIELQSV